MYRGHTKCYLGNTFKSDGALVEWNPGSPHKMECLTISLQVKFSLFALDT